VVHGRRYWGEDKNIGIGVSVKIDMSILASSSTAFESVLAALFGQHRRSFGRHMKLLAIEFSKT